MMTNILFRALVLPCLFISFVQAQFATFGGGMLVSQRSPEPVVELNVQSASFYVSPAYLTLSWMENSAKPTVITAVERSLFDFGQGFSNLGAVCYGLNLMIPSPIL